MTEFALDGLDGANPLAFLAALGTLRTADRIWSDAGARLHWKLTGAGWRARLSLADGPDESVLAVRIAEKLREGDDAFSIGEDLRLSRDDFADLVRRAQTGATSDSRSTADFLAAFGSEALSLREDQKDLIADTELRAVGGGQQRFLLSIRQLVATTDASHMDAALFRPWAYTDSKPSMRWDPSDDRRHALRWKAPTDDPIRTVRGANRLAIEALPLLPTAPVGAELVTTGFRRRRGEGVGWTWPIWTAPIGLDTVRSLLSLPALQDTQPNRDALARMGIAEAYRSVRFSVDKYRNFGQAMPVAAG